MLSQTAEYALRAVLHLAEHSTDRPVAVGEIAEALDVPRNYLSKTLHQLSRAGLITPTFGPRGGFRLAVRPDRLFLNTVLAAFGEAPERHCLLGRSRCRDSDPCSAHQAWKEVSGHIQQFFETTTVADLMGDRRMMPVVAPRRSSSRG